MDYKKRARGLLEENIKNKNLIKHNLAAAALMRSLAAYLGESDRAELWELSGLLHDLDWEKTADNPKKHGELGAQILEQNEFPEEVVQAIRRHNYLAGATLPETLMEKALYYGEEITGLVVAAALVLPEKKLGRLTVENIMNRFKEKAFARGVNRELLSRAPEKIGISLKKLAEIALEAMGEISEELGL